jgi:hypothetical protein
MASLPRCPKFRLLLILALLLCFSLPAFSQMETATISGTITDQTGAIIKSAEIKLTNVETGYVSTTTSNDSGLYVFPTVKPGHYRMQVVKQGFRQIVLTDLTVNVQDLLSRNFSLQVGVVGESVTVSGDVIKVNTQDASVSTVVDSQFVENMPLNGRSFQSLMQLTPGVVVDATFSGPGTMVVNGQRSDTNYFMIDGVSANVSGIGVSGNLPGFTVGGGTNGLVSVDAMQEFRIQTSTYAPEFGRSPGAQVSIATKGGSNQWHGTAFDYLRNDIFDARSYFDYAHTIYNSEDGSLFTDALAKPPLRQNDFGGTFSGPLWKDHTFFFFSYEGQRLRLPQTYSGYYFYDETAKAAVAASPTAGIWKYIVAAEPTGTGTLRNPACNNVTIPCMRALNMAYSQPSDFDVISLRLDHKLTQKISLFGRYSHAPSNENLVYVNSGNPNWANTDTATLGVTATISPTLVNDFRGNWSRQTGGTSTTNEAIYGAVNPPLSEVIPPGISTGSFTVGYYAGGGTPAFPMWGTYTINTQRQLNFVDTLSKTVGSHQLKFGVDYRRMNPTQLSAPQLIIQASRWASVLNGTANYVGNTTSDTLTSRLSNWSFFGQDTWKVSQRLTLTYGLRWEINTPPVSDTAGKPFYPVEGVFGTTTPDPRLGKAGGKLWNTQWNAFAPRVGAAFQVTPKTVLRGGFGLFYGLGYGDGANAAWSFPYSRGTYFMDFGAGLPVDFSYQDPNTNLYVYKPLPFTTTIGPEASGLWAIDPNLRLPVTHQWNAAIERQLGPLQSITATYAGAAGRKLLYNARLVPPGMPYIVTQLNEGSSKYNSLQVQFMRRMSHGLQATASYTYSRSFDNSSGWGLEQFGSVPSITIPPTTPSDFDVPHKITAAVSYDVPKLAWGGKVAEKITKGWSLDGLYRYQCGAPVDVTIEEYDPILGPINVRPERVADQPVWVNSSAWVNNMNAFLGYSVYKTSAIAPAGKLLNPLAFTLQANGQSADALRNSIRSPYGISQLDLALRRRLNLTERVKLDIRAEYFNAFNHPMFGGSVAPSATLGSCSGNTPDSCTAANASYLNSNFGTVGYGITLNQMIAPQPGGSVQGQDALYAVGGARSAQFTVRLSF